MPTLANGDSVTLALSDYDSVTVSTQGVVVVEALSGLGVAAGKIAEHTGMRTFGMFSLAGSLRLTAQGRAAQYEIADGTAPAVSGGGGGAAIDTLPSQTAIGNQSVDTVAVVVGGVASKITLDNLLDSIGVTDAELPAAGALNGADILPISQGGVAVRTTLAALATFLGGGLPAAPDAVTSLASGATTTTTIVLTWVNSTGATGWTVKQRLAGSGSYVDSTLSVAATATGATVSGLTASTAYDFQVFATNTGGTSPAATLLNVSSGAVGATAPGAPTIGTATAGDASASVTFTAPASNGGSAITGYTVTSSPGGITASGASSPINVTGLTNATAYTFTVTATNAIGTGAASAASNSVTPVAVVSYTVTPYSGNALFTTIDGTTPSTTQGSIKGFYTAKQATTAYWTITPDPASALSGWSNSNSVPPAEVTLAQNNSSGASSVNGLTPMVSPSTPWNNQSHLWVPVGSGTTTWYFWIKPIGGTAVCMNPSGTTVTGA